MDLASDKLKKRKFFCMYKDVSLGWWKKVHLGSGEAGHQMKIHTAVKIRSSIECWSISQDLLEFIVYNSALEYPIYMYSINM